ncbi:hypothetical protein GC425_06135 [Corynebacterium sp. zg254]|uniref:SAV-6107-like HEPN domain-containing protein n=1 Tax=Corynebacterium zhongnanshanii TaxID=2768834 RepID=A0ABQ6VEX3_9CORY|nr:MULTISPECIES: SAV_6107 family HEPN domain-containing protein [Corynebacterium]KAB3520826.1 hypothetical protein F8377_06155 [Corynebacterium zhongnanshanii]MCR5914445.1 hypothetical protein [Corynebacterium sp. zg254]
MATRMSARARMASARAFVEDAERQLELARAELRCDQSVVYSYRAALRAAGALIQWAAQDRQRIPQGSAWDKLSKLDPEMQPWVEEFRTLARLSSRADMGLEKGISPEVAHSIYVRVCAFVDVARGNVKYLPNVA